MATKRFKDWFFLITSVLRADGTTGGVRFRKSDKPTQATFEDFVASTTFSKESNDRAKPYTASSDLGTEQGLVVLATDAQAKAGTAQLSDRSLVIAPSQLPQVTTQTAVANEDMPLSTIEVNIQSDTTKNVWGIRLKNSWVSWAISRMFKQGGIEGDVPIKGSSSDYDWNYGNVGNNLTTVTTIANNTDFITELTTNSIFTTALQTTINNIITSNPQYFTDNLPVGIILSDSAVGQLGSKWVLANGAAISRTTYAALFAKIGITYGVGDGSTTFNIPNLSQRQVSGYDNTAGYTLGATGGAHTQTLIEANLPPHQHSAGSFNFQLNKFDTGTPTLGPYSIFVNETEIDPVTINVSGNTGNGAGTSTAFSIKDQYLSLPFYIKVLA
jgi:microcystin-dependent protein